MIDNINWYPGHMKKTRELIKENLKAVDAVVEIIDSRIPVSSRNPVIAELIGKKRRFVVLGKSDLADPDETAKWRDRISKEEGVVRAMDLNLQSGENIKKLLKALEEEETLRNAEKSIKRPLRIMIVGVPNVGKSSLINRLTGRRSAQTGDRPGVTKGKQWLTLPNGMQLLDTPGILWPKFEDPEVGLNLAFCGSIKDEIMDLSELALELIKVLSREYPELLMTRYKLDEILKDGDYSDTFEREIDGEQEAALANMEAIAKKRGFILPGKRIDYERTAKTLLDEFRSAAIGKITLEKV